MNNPQNEHAGEDSDNDKQRRRAIRVSSNNNGRAAAAAQLHPLQLEHQQQPWLIPHPNLPISWHNNDRAAQQHQARELGSHGQYPSGGLRPSHSTSLLCFNDTSAGQNNRPNAEDSDARQLQGYDWHQLSSSHGQQLQQYRDNISDQGHESDPSELIRPPSLLNGSPAANATGAFSKSAPSAYTFAELDREGRDIYNTIRRPNRSMSLSLGANVWHDGSRRRSPPALPSSSSRDHREVVPYSQEWRVILRSEPRGRTVLYNPQMQSLVVQTTVGLDSHPMSLRNDSRICALCRRPLDLDETTDGQDPRNSSSAFMDSNYFRMLSDANIALSRRGSLQGDPGSHFRTHSPLGSPTSSSRTSLDLDNHPTIHDDNIHGSSSNSSHRSPDNTSRPHPISPHLSHDALNQGYYERFFMEQKKLGRGYRGSVFLCQHVLDGIHLGEYAIKKVAVGDNHDWLVQMLREVHLLERLHHPNIVSYKHAWLENHQLHKFGPEVTCLFILMECANGGNLEEYIERPPEISLSTDTKEPEAGASEAAEGSSREPKKTLTPLELLQLKRQRLQGSLVSPTGRNGESSTTTEQEAAQIARRHLSITEIWSFFFDICEGLAHLHRLGIIHRDLKPPNLLLSYSNSQVKGKNGERPRILITDFGECEILDQAAKRDRTGATGTLEFLAPELLAVDAEGRYTDEFSFKGDMWSLGMVLYYLCYSRLPYSQIEDVDILRTEIRQFKFISIPEDEPGDRVVPEELKILIRVLLSPEKFKRPSCDDILSSLSHQRDRMMHGDMDIPTTPIRASTDTMLDTNEVDIAEVRTEEVLESEESDNGTMKGVLSSGTKRRGSSNQRQLSSKRSTRSLPSQPPQTRFPVRQHRSPTIPSNSGRRSSRTTLVTEAPNSGAAHVSLSASGARNTASPSVNLHKRVKPLGLGLRHMLRRRMMLPVANGIGFQKDVRSSDNTLYHGGRVGTSFSTASPVISFPSPSIDLQRRMPPMGPPTSGPVIRSPPFQFNAASTGRHQADMMREQAFQDRKQAVNGRESTLGLTMDLPHPALADEDDMKEGADRRSGISSQAGKSRRPDITSAVDQHRGADPSKRKKTRYDEQGQEVMPHRNAMRLKEDEAGDEKGSFADSADSDRDLGSFRVTKNNMIAQSRPALGKEYWTKLASAHAHERSLYATTATDASAEIIENESSDDDSSTTTTGAGGAGVGSGSEVRTTGAGGRRSSHSRRVRSAPQLAPLINKHTRPKSDRGYSTVQLRHHHHHHHPHRPPQHLQQQREGQQQQQQLIPEHFSVHFTFLSLVLRIWFCLSICNPILVRPLVLYPVLVLTVVWDRYLLSLVSDKFRKRAVLGRKHVSATLTTPMSSRRRNRSNPMDAAGVASDEEGEGGEGANTRLASSTSTFAPVQERQGLLRSSGQPECQSTADTGGTGDEDDEGEDSGDQDTEGALVIGKKRASLDGGSENQDHQGGNYAIPIWQALLSGIVLQLLWIGGISLFSRDGLCIA